MYGNTSHKVMPKIRDSQVTGRLEARSRGEKESQKVSVSGDWEPLVSGEAAAGKHNQK